MKKILSLVFVLALISTAFAGGPTLPRGEVTSNVGKFVALTTPQGEVNVFDLELGKVILTRTPIDIEGMYSGFGPATLSPDANKIAIPYYISSGDMGGGLTIAGIDVISLATKKVVRTINDSDLVVWDRPLWLSRVGDGQTVVTGLVFAKGEYYYSAGGAVIGWNTNLWQYGWHNSQLVKLTNYKGANGGGAYCPTGSLSSLGFIGRADRVAEPHYESDKQTMSWVSPLWSVTTTQWGTEWNMVGAQSYVDYSFATFDPSNRYLAVTVRRYGRYAPTSGPAVVVYDTFAGNKTVKTFPGYVMGAWDSFGIGLWLSTATGRNTWLPVIEQEKPQP